ncbi:hypothetical protein DPSP01_013528 [Paraphaeosphaeria sporulosa]
MFRDSFLYAWAVVQVCMRVAHALDCHSLIGLTISSPSDVAALNKCTNITAPVTINSSAPPDIQLNGPKALATLNATAAKSLHSISSSTLVEVGSITLTDLPTFHSLNFSALIVLDALALENLPALDDVTFGGLGPRSVVSVVNTALESVEWVKWPVSTSLNISSNADLEEISLPWDSVDGAVSISNNEKLDRLDVRGMKSITGSFTVEENDGLKTLAFGSLESVKGDVQLSGSFANISMPMLKKVTGTLAISSKEDIDASCAEIVKVDDSGKVNCTPNAQSHPPASPTPSNSPGNPPSPSSSATPDEGEDTSDLATGAKIGIVTAAVILGLFLVVGGVFFFRARSRGKVREIVISAPIPVPPHTTSSGQSVKSVGSISVGEVERAEAKVVGRSAGGLKLILNGEEMREVDMAGARVEGGGVGMEREASLSSVSSMGSKVPLVRRA